MATPGTSRPEALRLAVDLFAGGRAGSRTVEAVLCAAGEFLEFLDAKPARLVLVPAPFTFREGPAPGPGTPTRHKKEGKHMSVTMTDSEEVSYTVEPEDTKGFAVADTITWSSDDAGAVLTVTPSADGLSCVFASVAPGTATVTATDGTLSASDLITVTSGAVANLVLTPGAPVSE